MFHASFVESPYLLLTSTSSGKSGTVVNVYMYDKGHEVYDACDDPAEANSLLTRPQGRSMAPEKMDLEFTMAARRGDRKKVQPSNLIWLPLSGSVLK